MERAIDITKQEIYLDAINLGLMDLKQISPDYVNLRLDAALLMLTSFVARHDISEEQSMGHYLLRMPLLDDRNAVDTRWRHIEEQE